MQITDKQGDLIDTLWMTKITTTCPDSDKRLFFIITKELQKTNNFIGEFLVTLNYETILKSSCSSVDTATFRFWTKDVKGNFSDTVKTSPIIIDFE